MRSVAVIEANLHRSPLGTVSRLSEDLAGASVLTRTLQRAGQSKRLDAVVVVCPPNQYDDVSALCDATKVVLRRYDGPNYAAREIVIRARKWALNSWRGGIAGSCYFDEHTHPPLCLAACQELQPDVIVTLAAEAPWIDPTLIDDMIDHARRTYGELKLIFAQAPPGLAPTVFQPAFLQELSQKGLTPGWANVYRPDSPRNDLLSHPSCYRSALRIARTAGRLTSDTRRSFARLQSLTPQLPPQASALEICSVLGGQTLPAEAFPREIQIELTTADQHADTLLRPRGRLIGSRGPMSPELFRKIITEATQFDDILITLGGFGEPLLHPVFAELLDICRAQSVFGLAVRTNGIALGEDLSLAMMEAKVDVIQVMLDSTAAGHYRELQGCDAYDKVLSNIDQFLHLRQSRGQSTPFLFPSLVKSRETIEHMDAFFDHWVRRTGWALIEGYSHHAGLMPDRRVMNMAPPVRSGCGQLRDRLTVLATGDVTACDQDFKGHYVTGNIKDCSISKIWTGSRLQALRAAHARGDYAVHPMCAACQEWHRP